MLFLKFFLFKNTKCNFLVKCCNNFEIFNKIKHITTKIWWKRQAPNYTTHIFSIYWRSIDYHCLILKQKFASCIVNCILYSVHFLLAATCLFNWFEKRNPKLFLFGAYITYLKVLSLNKLLKVGRYCFVSYYP